MSFPRANTALTAWDCLGGSAGEMGDGVGNYRSPRGSTEEGGRMHGWVSLSPGELRAKGLRQIQARLDTEGVWRVPEVQGAAGKSRSRKFHVVFTDLHPLPDVSDVPTPIQHPACSSRGKLVWRDLLGRLGPSVPKVLQGSPAPMAFVGFLVQL